MIRLRRLLLSVPLLVGLTIIISTPLIREAFKPRNIYTVKDIASTDVPSDNGFHHFLRAAELIKKARIEKLLKQLSEEKRTSSTLDRPVVQRLLKRSQPALEALRKGLSVGNVSQPLPVSPNQEILHLHMFKRLGLVLTLEAELYATRGDYDTAFGDYATLIEFTEELARDGVLLDVAFAQDIQEQAINSLLEVLNWGDANAEHYHALARSLQSLIDNTYALSTIVSTQKEFHTLWLMSDGDELEKAREADRWWGLRKVRRVLTEDPSLTETDSTFTYWSHANCWQSILKDFSESEIEQDLKSISYEKKHAIVLDFLAFWDLYAERAARPYYEVGYDELFMPAIGDSKDGCRLIDLRCEYARFRYARQQAELRGALLATSIEAFDAENGHYPESLAALVPDYLSVLPEDPFAGKNFVYRLVDGDYILYSEGPDMEDNGGEHHSTHPPSPYSEPADLVLHGPAREGER